MDKQKYLCLRQDVYQPVTESGEDKTMYLQPGQEYELEGSELERLLRIGVVVLVAKPIDDTEKPPKKTNGGEQ